MWFCSLYRNVRAMAMPLDKILLRGQLATCTGYIKRGQMVKVKRNDNFFESDSCENLWSWCERDRGQLKSSLSDMLESLTGSFSRLDNHHHPTPNRMSRMQW